MSVFEIIWNIYTKEFDTFQTILYLFATVKQNARLAVIQTTRRAEPNGKDKFPCDLYLVLAAFAAVIKKI